MLIKSSILSPSTYQDWYIYRTSIPGGWNDEVRLVANYDPTTGTFTPDLPWTHVPAAGELYELHGLVDPFTALPDLMNEGLQRCWIPVEKSFTPPVLQRRFVLSTQGNPPTGLVPYLRDIFQVRQVGRLTPGLSRDMYDPFAYQVYGEVTTDGERFYLNSQIMFNGVDTVYLKTMARAYDVCLSSINTPAGWTSQGLTYEADQALPALDWVAAATLVVAWRRLALILEPSANQRLIKDAAQAAAWFTSQTELHLRIPPLTLRPLTSWGPRS